MGLVSPALPEIAPLWPDSVVLPVEEAAAEPLTPPSAPVAEALLAPLALTLRLSFTPLTPWTDLASFLASFLSSFLGTEPVSSTLPLLTEIWTFWKSGLEASCSWTWRCRVSSSTLAFLSDFLVWSMLAWSAAS